MTKMPKPEQKEKMETLLEEFSLTHVRKKISGWCFRVASGDGLR